MSKFVIIYVYTFAIYIAISIVLNLLFSSYYSWFFIFITFFWTLIVTSLTISKSDAFRAIFTFILLSIIWYIFLYPIKDGSWDGSTYHLEIMWNFIHGISFVSVESLDLWSHVYPKNQEILLSIFASLDPTYTDIWRIIKFILIGVATASVYHFTTKIYPKFRNYWVFFIIFGIILHPLILSQLFTKYIDDMLYLFLIIYIISFLSREYFISFILIGLFVGSKLNYVIYVIISLPLLIYIASMLQHKTWKQLLQDILNQFLVNKKKFFLVFILFTVIASYMYWINLFNYHNPLFPFLGTNKIEVVSNNLPQNLISVPKIIAHFYSLFSYSLSDFTKNAFILNPISQSFLREIIYSYKNIEVDTRMSWFWTVWSILLCISLLTLPFIFVKYRKIIVIAWLTIIGILLFMPFAWARFIPFLYLVPLLIWMWISRRYRNYYMFLAYVLLGINLVFYVWSYYWRYYFHNWIQNVVTEYYIKKNDIWIIGYFPWKTQNSDKKRISDYTQNELYHLDDPIPLITYSAIQNHCSEENVEELFNKWDKVFDILRPLVVECDENTMLIRTRGYIYRDYFLAKKNTF